MFKLLYHPRVFKFLEKLSNKEKKKILGKLEFLGKDPFTKRLDIKRLATTKRSFRLRIGNLRVIYEVDSRKKIIYLQEIGFRGSIY